MKKKTLSIKSSVYLTLIVPAIILLFILAGSIALSVIYAQTNNNVVLIVLIAFVIVLSFLYILAMLYAAKGLKYVYVESLYEVTRNVLGEIEKGKVVKSKYPVEAGISEFRELNKEIDTINTTFANSTIIYDNTDYSNIPLEFVAGDEHAVSLDSFKNYLQNVIYVSQNFRNVLLEVSYDLVDDSLDIEETSRLISIIKDAFADYPNYLIMPNGEESGYFVYLPHINSFSRIREICLWMMKNLSIAKKTYDGLKTIYARFTLVCYPHSNINELFTDIRYAKRQGQPINFYFPDRLSSLADTGAVQSSMNLNNMTKILNALSDLKVSSRERNKSFEIISRTIESIISYLGFEEAGIIYKDPNTESAKVIIQNAPDDATFHLGDSISAELLNTFNDNKDPDYSYYFSSRVHANIDLIRMLDRYGIESGFYYVLCEKDNPRAVIYFFNRTKHMVLDSYIRESLFVFSYRVSDFLLLSEKEDDFNDTYREINSLLMVSDFTLYRIDPSNYNLVSFSQHLPTIFPNAKRGVKCYKALYGLDAPCASCPLKTSKKMFIDIEGTHYEMSLTLNDKNVRLKRMLVHKVGDSPASGDRFDMDLLINSYASLSIALKCMYAISGRGYLLVLRIDNHDELVKKFGSEGYLFALRQFINEIKQITQYGGQIYSHDPMSIAILMPEAGQIDVVNLCEKIYEASKHKFVFDEQECQFNLTYLPYNFPQAYPEAGAFLKYVIRNYLSNKFEKNRDYIYFPDGEYSRSASRNQFMLAVIDEQFGANTFKAVLQPMVRAANGAIYGAELFIRISDEYRGSLFNTDELIRVAAKNGKIPLISNSLVRFIGDLYNKYGQSNFKIYGFNRLTINTDFSYFSDENFFKDIKVMLDEYRLPRGFLGFEINESEIMNNREKFEALSHRIVANHIALICDQYTGAYLSIDYLKSLGFEEIKIPRNFVGDIEINEKHRNEISSIIRVAKDFNMHVSLVGVENSNQYVIIRDIDKECGLQGYHFYRPLDRTSFIDALRDNNSNNK